MPPPLILSILQRPRKAEGGPVANIPLDQLYAALRAADAKAKAGDPQAAADAKAIAAMITKAQGFTPEKEQPNLAADLGMSAIKGLEGGAEKLAGLPGNLVTGSMDLASRALNPNMSDEERRALINKGRINTPLGPLPPTSEEIHATVKPVAGPVQDYQSKTYLGDLTEAGMDLVPGVLATSGATTIPKLIGAAAKLGFIPGMIGKTAADLAPEEWKPYVQFAGDVAGAGLASIGANAARSFVTNPTRGVKVPPAPTPPPGPPSAATQAAINRIMNSGPIPQGQAGAVAQQMLQDMATLRAAGYPIDTAPTLGAAIKAGPRSNPFVVTPTQVKAELFNRILADAKTNARNGKDVRLKIQDGFAALEKSMRNPNSSNYGLFTEDEQAIITKIAQGETVENLLKKVGNISPNLRTILVEGGLAAGAEFLHSGSPVSSALAAGSALTVAKGVGSAAKAAANLRQDQNVGNLGVTIINNGKSLTPNKIGTLNIPTISGVYAPSVIDIPDDLEDRYP